MRWLAMMCLLCCAACPLWGQDDGAEAKSPDRAKFDALTKQHEEAVQEFWEAFSKVADDDRRSYYDENFPKADKIAPQMLEIAESNAGKPIGLEAISWMFENNAIGDHKPKAMEMLQAHYLGDKGIAPMLGMMARDYSEEAGSFLKAAMESPDREVQGHAHFHYAKHLLGFQDIQGYLAGASEEDLEGLTEYLGGPEALERVRNMDAKKLAAKAEKLLDEVVADYAELPFRRGRTIGAVAEKDLFELRNLSIGKVAPEIRGEDIAGVEFALSDYRGKVIFLDFWGDW